MDDKTKGAWIIHHTNKLQGVNSHGEYDQVNFAGKCGLLLSNLSSSENSSLSLSQVEAFAKAVNISVRLELPAILEELKKHRLIILGQKGIDILGLTSGTVLTHTSSIFESITPHKREQAVLDIAEKTSILPILRDTAHEYISDTFKIPNAETNELLNSAEDIGFIDTECVDDSKKLLFNGNLFRHDAAKKISAVSSSLSEQEISKMLELDDILKKQACITLDSAEKIIGKKLFSKLQSIGLYDVNKIGNESGNFAFVTKPSSFVKFSGIVDDAFDLAKSFVTSLSYGMTQSDPRRGRITMIRRLMNKLIDGHWIGPATAIGQDYRVLEMRRVVQVKPAGYGMFSMKLLKKEVGQLALQVITEGDISTESLVLPGASITSYIPPEPIREYERKKQSPLLKQSIAEMLNSIRIGVV